MSKVFLLFLVSVFSTPLFSADEVKVEVTALVQRIVGTVTLDGKLLKTRDIIDKPGMLVTGVKSLIQFQVPKWNNQISIGPSSQMMLNFTADKKYTLEEGTCRWKSALTAAASEWSEGKAKAKIHTKYVAFGIRGTDFLLKVKRFSLFNETEIIMFEGSVSMENIDDPTNSVIVSKGQWAGLGGRYGKKINPPLELPQSILDSTILHVGIE